MTQDGRFFSQPVDELLQNKEFSKVPLITGITNDEGGFGLPSVSDTLNICITCESDIKYITHDSLLIPSVTKCIL